MDDYGKLNQLLADGYLVQIDAIELSKLDHKGARFFSNDSTQLSPEILLDPSNRDKYLVSLINPSNGHRVNLLTSNENVIRRSKEQLRYQQEPVESFILVLCAALGGKSSREKFIHVDNMVTGLDGLWGWKFTLGDFSGTFKVKIRIASQARDMVEEVLEKLQLLLYCLAVIHQVGFHIQHYSFTSTPRCTQLPYWGATGPAERMLTPVKLLDIENIKATLLSGEALDAARGLNEAYIENTMASRLSRLWAAVETVFGSDPQRLLEEEEISSILAAAKGIESLSKDSYRLDRLKQILVNPLQSPLHSRNEVIAKAIAPVLDISVDDAYSKVRNAARLRGKLGHGMPTNISSMENSEKFLQEALVCYITKQEKS
jgi:hypothetical protein